MELEELTAEQRAKPYAKYYHRPLPPASEMIAALADGPMDSSLALDPLDVNLLLTPEKLTFDGTGWCSFENGGGYVQTCHQMPGVTRDMLEWYFCWHPVGDSLRYKIWYANTHFDVQVDEKTKERLLDESIPMSIRNYGCVHQVYEDIFDDITEPPKDPVIIHFRDPVEIGFDPDLLAKHPEVSILCAYSDENDVVASPQQYRIMCHVVRDVPGGVEFRSRVWRGWAIREGKPKLMLPEGMSIPPVGLEALARHNISEYTNLKYLLPSLYLEEGWKRPLSTD